MLTRRARGLGFVVILVLCLIAWYYYEVVLRDKLFRLSWPPVRVEDAHDVVEPEVGDVVEVLEQLSATVTAASSPLSPTPTVPATSLADDVKADSQDATKGSQSPLLSPDDVLLIFKTGASTIWRRMPLHLSTTLSNNRVPHYVIYSDLPEQLSPGIHAIDALENATSIIRQHDPDAYASYLELQSPDHINTYREHGRLPGDEPPDQKAGNTPGWLLDKYKFLPMLTHARQTFPGKKWYVYIEDDTYLFLPSLLSWLSTQSYNSTPTYFGAYSGEGNETFAQGGSGLVFSQSLMETVFGGEKIADLKEYGNYTSTACCGDVALGKVLRDYDIYVNEGDYGPVSFRSEPPWKTAFGELIWCSPVFTFHHLHQRNIAQLAALEDSQHQLNASRPLLFRDIFMHLIIPHISPAPRKEWDNFASLYILSSSSPPSFPDIPSLLTVPSSPSSLPANLTHAHADTSSCAAACASLPGCLAWRHEILREKIEEDGTVIAEERRCALDTSVRLGRETDPLLVWERRREIVSGWDMEKIEGRLLSERCESVGKVVL